MSVVGARLAEARERIDPCDGSALDGFDKAVAICREEIARLNRHIDSLIETIGEDQAIARAVVAGKDATIGRLRTALEYKNTTIERMQAEHDDALEAKSAEIARLKDELSRWKHVC